MDLDYHPVTAQLDGLNITLEGREGREREMLQKSLVTHLIDDKAQLPSSPAP